jgi:hypothetical protein
VTALHSCVSAVGQVEQVVVELNAEVERTCRMELTSTCTDHLLAWHALAV